MNTLSKKLLFVILVSLVFSVAGCSTTEEKDLVGAESSEQAAQAEAAKSSEKQALVESEKKEVPQPATEAKEESVVEVIPSQTGKDTELTVEAITAPEPADVQPPIQPIEPAKTLPAEAEEVAKETASLAAVPDKKTAADQLPVSTGPDHFVITAAKKDSTHPHFGKGHVMGFLVNNEQGKEIVLERGKTYRFDVATDPMHDVYISLKEIGWGSTPYSEGIEGMYTYKGTITIKPDEKTPDLLFYSCRNHPYMGGKIHIVNPGQTVEIATKSTTDIASPSAAQALQISEADVNQKIMFADMLLKSKNSETVLKSNISDAIELHKKGEAELQSARANLAAGKNAEAYKQAENAIAIFKKSTKLVPNESALEQLKERNKELLASIKDFEASHKENYERTIKKQGKDAAVDYDKDKVKKLMASAEEFSRKGDYVKANQDLEQVQHIITVALHKMLNNQTIVYDLNFETPQEEYDYELRRFKGYEELVPIAVEQKNPAEGAKKLMESFVKKGQDLRDRAIKAAKDGDYPTAIAMLQDATKDVRRGLRMIGVMQ
ncbi:tetratricopeptide repeat protein [Kaarinaea lacus]